MKRPKRFLWRAEMRLHTVARAIQWRLICILVAEVFVPCVSVSVANGDETTACPQERAPYKYIGDVAGGIWARDVSFSGDSRRLVTAVDHSQKRLFRVWDIPSCKPVKEPLRHDDAVSARLTSDGQVLFTASDHEVRLWDVQTSAVRSVTNMDGEVGFAKISPDGTRFITQNRNDWSALQLWRAGEHKPFAELRHNGEVVQSAAFDDTGAKIVSFVSTRSRSFRLWDGKTGAETSVPVNSSLLLMNPDAQVASFTSGGKRIVIARNDGFAMLDVSTGQILSTGELAGEVKTEGVVVSGEGATVAVETWDPNVKEHGFVEIFDAVTGKHSWTIGKGPIIRCCITPDGMWLLCCSIQPGVAQLWNLANGKMVQTFPANIGGMSPDGNTIAICEKDKGTTSIWRRHEK